MAVKYISIDNEKVSAEWYSVLKDMRDDGVYFNVNEGHRTMARQWYFYNLWRSGKGNLAAYPSPFAPHIRTGRIDHAIDFANDGAVYAWLSRKGLHPRRIVVGESWHIELSAASLRRYHQRNGAGKDRHKLGVLTKTEREWVLKRYYHYDGMAKEGKTGKGPKYLKHLGWSRFYKRRIQLQMRALIRDNKGEKNPKQLTNRRQRYSVLKAAYNHKLDL